MTVADPAMTVQVRGHGKVMNPTGRTAAVIAVLSVAPGTGCREGDNQVSDQGLAWPLVTFMVHCA
jgi:hypothetical protein